MRHPGSRTFVLSASLAAALLAGCASGEESSADVPGAATDAGGGDAGATLDAHADAKADGPPSSLVDAAPPDGPAIPATGNFAIWKVYLGDVGYDDEGNTDAWKAFGDDVDGKQSDSTSEDICTPTGPATNPAAVDGPGGVDNAFGHILLPLINAVAGLPFADRLNANLAAGEATLLVRTDLLASPDAGAHDAKLYTTTKFIGSPALDGTDVFEIDQSSLDGPTLDDATAHDPSSQLTGDILTVAPPRPVLIASSYAGVTFHFTVHRPRLTLQLDAARSRVLAGKITGTLNTQEFLAQLRLVVGAIDTSYCSGITWNGIQSQIMNAQDIMTDGTNEPGAPCDAISVGMGFKAVAASYGPTPKTVPPPASNCDP